MAVEYTLTDTAWRPRSLVKFLTGYAQTLPAKVLSDPVQRMGATVRGRLFTDGSLRGADLVFSGRAFRTAAIVVRIGMLASRTDWVLAFDLMRALLREGKGHLADADGDVVGVAELTENEAAGLATKRLAIDAAEIRRELLERNRPFAALAGPDYDLIVTPDDLPTDETDPMRFGMALEERLTRRALRYEMATAIPVMQAGDMTAFVYWPCCDALVDRVPYIAVAQDEDDEPRVVAWRTFATAFGPYLESVSPDEDRFFLPGDVMPNDLKTAVEQGAPFHAWASAHTVQLT